MEVELDIFSGRANPRWRLDHIVESELLRLHGQLVATAREAPEPPGLGYRGFLYRLAACDWRAYRGFVLTRTQNLLDPDSAIERLILQTLPDDLRHLKERIELAIGR